MTKSKGFHIFPTALGFVGLGWSDTGITRVLTPQSDRSATFGRMRRLEPEALETDRDSLPPFIRAAIDLVNDYADGVETDFSTLPLDLSGIDDFRLDIYAAARRLGFGETVTYGGLADRAGHGGLARETGKALGENPVPIIVPCHRIVAANGKIGGFSAPGGSHTKEKLLALEGVTVGPPPPAQAALPF